MELKLGKMEETTYSKKRPERAPAKTCNECGLPMKELSGSTPDGVKYRYFRCEGCGDEIVNTNQLHEVAMKSKAVKTYTAKITRWGQSLGMRIPKELSFLHDLENSREVTIIPEKEGFRVLPIRK